MRTQIWRVILSLCFFALVHFSNGVPDCQTYKGIQTVPVNIQLPFGSLIDSSPGTKLGTIVTGDRVCIPGLRRFQHLKKYAHSWRVTVQYSEGISYAKIPGLQRLQHLKSYAHSRRVTLQYSEGISSSKIELCIHRNVSLGLGQCPLHEWKALVKGLWTGVMSPYETKFIDFRMPDTLFGSLTISVEEEFQQYRLVFLGLAFAMLILAPIVNKWVPFYYSSAMAFGIVAVILFFLFQGMNLQPTKSTLYIIICGSVVGHGSVILNYILGLLHSALQEIEFGEQLFNPVAMFVLLFIFFIGARIGFWGVRKLAPSEDRSVERGTALFVASAIRIVAAVMILQSTNDTMLAMLMFIVGVILTSALTYMLASFSHSRQRGQLLRNKKHNPLAQFLYRLLTKDGDLLQSQGTAWKWHQYNPHMANPSLASPTGTGTPGSYVSGSSLAASRETSYRSHTPGSLSASSTSTLSSYFQIDNEDYCSTFHEMPERKHFSKKEWNVLTKRFTRKAIKELLYTPEFSEWALANADRIMINPDKGGDYRDPYNDNSDASTEVDW